jgi:hypothetical protein
MYPMIAARKPAPSARKKTSKASVRIAVGVFGLLLVAGMAQAAWRVYDQRVESAVKNVKDEVKALRDDLKPRWQGHGGAHYPYQNYADPYKEYNQADSIAERPINEGATARCGSSASQTFNDQTIWKIPADALRPKDTPLNDAALNTLRGQLCAQLVAAENMRFRALAETMKRMKQRNQALKLLTENRSNIEYAGQRDDNTNNLQAFIADSQMEIQHLQLTVAAYDSLIASLKGHQDNLAERVLNGEQDPIASGVRLTALGVNALAVDAVFDALLEL